ncbi:MAG: SIMPL domain-containing protein [Anaerolineales bacterium]|nr:SIMPL domain-containing protein [Anaerolineales bacterium]
MTQLLTVQGYGSASATPDQAVISFVVEHQNKEYAKCIDGLNHMADEFFKSIKSAGIKEDQVKMSNFEIQRQGSILGGKQVRIFWGYEASYSFKLRLDLDHKTINRVLNAVTRTSGFIRIDLGFTVKDDEGLKNQALEKAISDAKIKAEIIGKATGVQLGKIQHINYGREIMEITSRHMPLAMSENFATFSEEREINPEDVDTHDYVNITWEIEG